MISQDGNWNNQYFFECERKSNKNIILLFFNSEDYYNKIKHFYEIKLKDRNKTRDKNSEIDYKNYHIYILK